MFGVEMECEQQEPCSETAKTLKKRFKKITAVNRIKSEGVLDGTFQIAFDKEGLFTLAGTIVMLPEQRILQNRKTGSVQDAEDLNDAIGEAGNMLVGSWDRVFREELEGHGHFVQTDTFIGDPWSDPEGNIGLPSDQEFLFIPYEITIDSYPAFNCGVIFQDELFGSTSATDTDQDASTDEKTEEETQEQETVAENNVEPEDKVPAPVEEKAEVKEPEDKAPVPVEEKAEVKEPEDKAPAPVEEKAEVKEPEDKTPAPVEEKAEIKEPEDKTPAPVEEKAEVKEPEDKAAAATEDEAKDPEPAQQESITEDSPKGAVSESIQRIVQSSANLPGEHMAISTKLCAEDVMQKQVIWVDPEDTVQQAMTKMQQADAGYIMVGTDGTLEGLISDSDISGTISVYLKPIFAKWRRPTDDATLQIRVKWIMTRPVQTIKQDTPLTAIMNTMGQSGTRCLPVIDQQGKVSGIVTVFGILKALLNTDPDVSTVGKTNHAPPLE